MSKQNKSKHSAQNRQQIKPRHGKRTKQKAKAAWRANKHIRTVKARATGYKAKRAVG